MDAGARARNPGEPRPRADLLARLFRKRRCRRVPASRHQDDSHGDSSGCLGKTAALARRGPTDPVHLEGTARRLHELGPPLAHAAAAV